MHRFFVDAKSILQNYVILADENAAHAAVLRLNIGEKIVISDGGGWDYFCTVSTIEKHSISCEISHSEKNLAEPAIAVTLFQALPKGDKLSEIVEKCVELGISQIIPTKTARCIAKISQKDVNKTVRLRKIAESAAKQCGRGKIPIINETIGLDTAINLAKHHGIVFVCYENESSLMLPHFLKSKKGMINSIAFFVGPEGGFAPEEIIKFAENGVSSVSLGSRILRTQTAGSAVLANILYEFEVRR